MAVSPRPVAAGGLSCPLPPPGQQMIQTRKIARTVNRTRRTLRVVFVVFSITPKLLKSRPKVYQTMYLLINGNDGSAWEKTYPCSAVRYRLPVVERGCCRMGFYCQRLLPNRL